MSEGAIDTRSSDGITVVTINHPAKRNAMSAAMCSDLRRAWETFRDSDDRVAILTAQGDIFTAGADLRDPPSQFWKALPDVGVEIGKPVIAALNGPVIGLGVAMVAFCDLCVASRQSRFIYPEARVGVAAGLISSIATRIPHKVALELMLLGEPISAQRAYEVGLVNRLTEPGAQLEEALQMAGILSRSAPLVLRLLKQMVRETLPRSPIESMYLAQFQAEQVLHSQDAQEGLAAFREKRQPRFTGK
jgi:enoyl-CoA hydratase